MTNLYKNLETQFNKVFRHLKVGSFKTRERYAKYALPTNDELESKRRTFGGVDRTWDNKEYNLMVAKAMETNHSDYAAIFTLARYAGLRLEECFRIDNNDADKAKPSIF